MNELITTIVVQARLIADLNATVLNLQQHIQSASAAPAPAAAPVAEAAAQASGGRKL